jgi:hypothetical protein
LPLLESIGNNRTWQPPRVAGLCVTFEKCRATRRKALMLRRLTGVYEVFWMSLAPWPILLISTLDVASNKLVLQ